MNKISFLMALKSAKTEKTLNHNYLVGDLGAEFSAAKFR
jgi:hypothetical protein